MADSSGASAKTGSTVRKPCVICSAECDGRARVKDPQGRYYCRACYDRKAAELQSRQGAVADVTETDPLMDPAVDFRDLAVAAAAAPVDATAMATCPACHGQLAPGSVFCVACGHDLRTGVRASVNVVKARKAPPPKPGRAGVHAGRTADASSASYRTLVGWTMGFGGSVPALIAIATAMSDAVARAATRSQISAGGNQGLADTVNTPYLVGSLIGAVIGGFLWSYLGPWWFRVRVGWAGGDADRDAARSSYFATLLPYTVIAICVALLLFTSRGGGGSAGDLAGLLSLGGLGFIFLSCVWLFWIAKEAFGVRPVRGILLLIGLPWAVYIAVIVIAAILLAAATGMLNRAGATPNATPRPSATLATHEASAAYPIRLRYPSNWTVEELPPQQDGVFGVAIEGSDGASVAINVSTEEIELDSWMRSVTDEYRSQGFSVQPSDLISQMGGKPAHGYAFVLRKDRTEMLAQLAIVKASATQWLLVEALTPQPDRARSEATVTEIMASISLPPK